MTTSAAMLAWASVGQSAGHWLTVLADASLKGAVILGVAGAVTLAMRKSSATARHLVWLLAMVGLLVLPVLSVALPGWAVLPQWIDWESKAALTQGESAPAEVTPEEPAWETTSPIIPPEDFQGTPIAGEIAPREAAVPTETPAPAVLAADEAATEERFSMASVLPWVMLGWAAGVVICLAPLVLGSLSLWRLKRSARPAKPSPLFDRIARQLGLKRPVILLVSDHRPMPMIWGIFKSKLLLPTEAYEWSPQRQRVVLLHELAHAVRWDCLAKLVAHVACALYWFNPLCWVAFKRMQMEAESACDDLVLNAGAEPSKYAEHILEIASGLQTHLLAAHSSIAMARKSKLEGRLLAILDPKRSRRRLTIFGAIIAVLLVAGFVVPISIMRAREDDGHTKLVTLANIQQIADQLQIGVGRMTLEDVLQICGQPDMSLGRGGDDAKPFRFKHVLAYDFTDSTTNQRVRLRVSIGDNKLSRVLITRRIAKPLKLGDVVLSAREPDDVAASQPATQPKGSRLEFRIAPSPSALDEAELASYRNWLKAGRVGFWWKGGRIRGRMPDYAWLPIADELTNSPVLVTGEHKGKKYMLVSDKPDQAMLQGEGRDAWGLAKVRATTDSLRQPAVGFEFDNRGTELFTAFTKANVKNVIAIVIDGKVVSAPVLMTPLSNRAMIPGRFSEQEVKALVKALKIGMPPASDGTIAPPTTPRPADVNNVAREFLTALRGKNLDKMKSLSLGSVTGWLSKDQAANLPAMCPPGIYAYLLEKGLRVLHKEIYTDRPELITQIQEIAVQNEWAAVRLAIPDAKDKKYAIIVFRNSPQGWRFVCWHKAKGPLVEKLAKYSQSLEKILAAAGKHTATQPGAGRDATPLADILKLSSRWKIFRGLREKKARLSDEEIGLLEKFAEKNRRRDWMLRYEAIRLLRKHKPGKYPAPPTKVLQVETLLARMRGGKVPHGRYDEHAPGIAALGNDALETLLEMLKYSDRNDRYRRRVAIKALGVMKDARIVPALKDVATKAKRRNIYNPAFMALLTHDASDTMADWVANRIAAHNGFDQRYDIAFLAQSELAVRTKMRLYSHYGRYKPSGQGAVIRGLQAVDTKEAFGRLVKILQKRDRHASMTAHALGQLKNSDPCEALLKALRGAPPRRANSEAILALAERRHRPAIKVLERIVEGTKGTDQRSFGVLAAGALCRLGKDYQANAAIVRAGFHDDQYWSASHRVVKWLDDPETIKLLISRIGKRKPISGVTRLAIRSLGEIGNRSAVPALTKALKKLPLEEYDAVAEAVRAIGEKNNSPSLVSWSEGLRALVRVVRHYTSPSQRAYGSNSPEARRIQQTFDRAVKWLKEAPELIPTVLTPPKDSSYWRIVSLLPLLDKAWDDRAVPFLEKAVKTNTTVVSVRIGPGRHVRYYRTRSIVAKFLTDKTGRQCTFVDIDGTIRKGGWYPRPTATQPATQRGKKSPVEKPKLEEKKGGKREFKGALSDGEAAAKNWLKLVDAGKYGESWDIAAVFFKKALKRDQWKAALKQVRKPLSDVLSRELLSLNYTTTLPNAPAGEYVVIQYKTNFVRCKNAVETITPMKDKDGQWRVSGYYIKTNVPGANPTTGGGAPKPSATQPGEKPIKKSTDEKPKLEEKESGKREFKATLPNGATVELLAVSNLKSPDKKWWRPDGGVLAEPPSEGMELADKNYQYEFLFNFMAPAGSELRCGPGCGQFLTPMKHLKGEMYGMASSFQPVHGKPAKSTKMNIGVAVGKWQNEEKCKFKLVAKNTKVKFKGGEITCSKLFEKNGRTFLNVKYQSNSNWFDHSLRLVALTKRGKTITPKLENRRFTKQLFAGAWARQPLYKGKLRFPLKVDVEYGTEFNSMFADYSFPVGLSEINSFQLQARPIEYVGFWNVSLQPGHKTDVKVAATPKPKGKSKAAVNPKPKTPAAKESIVIDPNLPWRSSGWAGNINTDIASRRSEKNKPIFEVGQADRRHVWTYYLNSRFSPREHPIAVLTYRASGIKKDGRYVLWLDDTRGPNSGGIVIFRSSQLIADGKVHELRQDMRKLKPGGDIIGMALGVHCGPKTPATFELLGLRFEPENVTTTPGR